ncbi:MAG TPA: DNA recombination protein RmuC [Deltaproteobacteria bacterium]|nr:DNA recombination protein RmuC [Candidatus Binatota bacterium]HIL14020.1 DNA recombination protein RmuC [Deltaproteobacteria bacterium]
MDIVIIVLLAGVLATTLVLILRGGGQQELDTRELEQRIREDLTKGLGDSRRESSEDAGRLRGEVNQQLERVQTSLGSVQTSLGKSTDQLRGTLEERLREMQEGNAKKLDEMRQTVDEKLQGTLEKRLGESFKLVSERLEAVQKGLGEMQELAGGVRDLKSVLTNVKARGTWGEVQLGALLEQVLTPSQYDRNVKTREGSDDLVEFAVRLPGSRDEPDSCVWMPIDSKFPQEDYLRLVDAADRADAEGVAEASKALVRVVKKSAADIAGKYLDPPRTTDFAILFLPTEGLYAEVIRQPGLVEDLQSSHRVTVAGPSTLLAQLNALRMGFRTLAIEERSSEVWKVLGAVKSEFGKFGDVLAKVKKQLNTAASTIEQTETRTRAMERKLRSVEELPDARDGQLLGLDDRGGTDDDDDDGVLKLTVVEKD